MANGVLDKVSDVVGAGESFLVTQSGGADSVALLVALTELGHYCHALHCNYHLRGAESDRDEQHARRVAGMLGVPVEVIHCDVKAYRSAHSGQSVEMACRELRYEQFERARQEYGLDSIAIGHHLEDNIETMLLNMLRGSGVKGLAAMSERRGQYVRPLLRCTKDEILSYLQERGIEYVTDSSNLSNDYRRNALRNDIIPHIRNYFPDVVAGMSRTLTALANQRDLLADSINRLYQEYVEPDGSINIERLVAREQNCRAVLFELLNHPDYRGYNLDIVDNILKGRDRSGSVYSGADGTSYLLERGQLVKTVDDVDDSAVYSIDIDDRDSYCRFFDIERISRDMFAPQRDASVAYFDLDKLMECSLVVRHPRVGDRLYPYGMSGSRLLSDIFTDLHMGQRQRRRAWVLEADGKILWLAGIRASRHYAVTSATVNILKLSFINQNESF